MDERYCLSRWLLSVLPVVYFTSILHLNAAGRTNILKNLWGPPVREIQEGRLFNMRKIAPARSRGYIKSHPAEARSIRLWFAVPVLNWTPSDIPNPQ